MKRINVVEIEPFKGLRGGLGKSSRCLVARCQSEEAVCVNFFPTLIFADKIRVWPFGFKREEKQQQALLPGSLNRDLNPGAAVSAVTVSLSVVEKTLRCTCLSLQAGQRSEALHVGHYRYILTSSDEAARLISSCKRSSSSSRM